MFTFFVPPLPDSSDLTTESKHLGPSPTDEIRWPWARSWRSNNRRGRGGNNMATFWAANNENKVSYTFKTTLEPPPWLSCGHTPLYHLQYERFFVTEDRFYGDLILMYSLLNKGSDDVLFYYIICYITYFVDVWEEQGRTRTAKTTLSYLIAVLVRSGATFNV